MSIIEKAMKECHIAVKPNKTSKQQALDTIGKLKTSLPIERAMMRMKIVARREEYVDIMARWWWRTFCGLYTLFCSCFLSTIYILLVQFMFSH